MKTTLTTLILILAGVTFAQNEVAYTYDNAGNRIKRENNTTFFIPPSTPQESSALSELNNSGIGLEAYPNPTAGNTVVTIIIDPETISEEHKIALASGVNMQVADITGKVLKTEKGTSLEQTIDMQGLAKGVYFVKVFTKSGQLVGERKILRE